MGSLPTQNQQKIKLEKGDYFYHPEYHPLEYGSVWICLDDEFASAIDGSYNRVIINKSVKIVKLSQEQINQLKAEIL